jgi:hypothetical protein
VCIRNRSLEGTIAVAEQDIHVNAIVRERVNLAEPESPVAVSQQDLYAYGTS